MNKVNLIGRLTKDPEIKYTTTSNKAVCNFTLAVNRRFVKQGEERQADFISIIAWDKNAEFCAKYFQKGQQVAVSGRIQTRTWDDNYGKKHYVTEVVYEEGYFTGTKTSRNESEYTPPDLDDVRARDENGFYTVTDDDELPF